MKKKRLQRFILSFVAVALTIVYLIPMVFNITVSAAPLNENWLPDKYIRNEEQASDYAGLRAQIERQDEFNRLMSNYENLKKNDVKKTEERLKVANKILGDLITEIKKGPAEDGFDWGSNINNLFSAASGIFSCVPGWGGIASGITDIIQTCFNAYMGGEDPPSAEALMEDRLNQKLDEIADQLSGIEEQIGELSNQINDQTNTILAGLSDSFDNAEAKAKLAEFMLCTGSDDFGYNQYRNYIYGLAKNNSSGSTAYYNLLLHAQTSGASDEVIKTYYDALYNELYDNRDIFRDYVIGTESGKSIVQYYYDVVSARPDLLEDGISPEMAAVQFAYDLYQTQLMTDQIMLMCNNYQYVQMLLNDSDVYWFGDEQKDFIAKTKIEGDAAVDTMYNDMLIRENEIIDQLAKDLVYALQINETYTIKKTDGQVYTLNTETVNGTTYAKVLVGQTVCLNRIPDYVCELFEINAYDYEYEGEGIYDTDGLLAYSANIDVVVSIKYKGEIVDSLTFTDGSSGEFAGGKGTEEDPYLISTAQQFLNISNELDKHYKLISDIDFEKDGVSLTYPVGWHRNSVGTDVYDAFEGVLNGNGYAIKNASLALGNYTALFSKVGEFGVIRNVIFDNISVEATVENIGKSVGSFYCGIVAATNDGLIENCTVLNSTISVTGNTTNEGVNRTVEYKAGSVAGINTGAIVYVDIDNCVLTVQSTHDFAGASTKQNQNSVCVGGVTGDNIGYVGYVVVNNNVEITAKAHSVCNQSTTVSPYVTSKAGGIVATNDAPLEHFKDVYSDAVVSSKATADSDSKYDVYKKHIETQQTKYINGFDELNIAMIQAEKDEIISAFPVANILNIEFIDNESYSVCEPELHKDATLTVDGKVKEYSILAIYGFDTHNDSEKYTQTRNITLLLAVKDGEDYTMVSVNSSITVGKDYVAHIEPSGFKTEYIKGETISDTLDILQYYASGEDKCIPVNNAKVNIGNASATNTIGTHTITITYNGISCNQQITVACPYENYYENKEHYNKVNEVVPTCNNIGYDEFECQECGEVVQTNFKAKTNHSFAKEVSKDASCKEEGLIGKIFCSICNMVAEQEVTIPKLPHVVVMAGDTTIPASQLPTAESHYCKSGDHRIAHDYTVSESIIDGVLTYTYTCTECKYVNTVVDTNIITNAEKMQPTVVVSDGYALKGGDVVTVYVSLINNPGVTGGHFGIRYDERLTFLDDWSEGTLFTQSLASDSAPVNCGYNFIWGNSDTRSNDGTLLILKFRLPDDATTQDKYSVSVVYTSNNGTIEGFSIDSKVLNAYNLAHGTNLTTSDPIHFITKNGTIQLVDHLPGDVNGDGVVDILDALHLSHTIVYEKQTEEINKYGDVNLSGGNANVSDVVDILKSLTGAYGNSLLYHEYKLIVNTNGYVDIPSTNFVQLYGENCTYDKILTDEINDLMTQREGYKFIGWFTRLENGTEIKLSDVIKYDPNQKIQTVYARWEKNSVSFDMNGATSEKLEGLTYGGSDRYITLTTPEEKYNITFADPNNSKNSKTSTMNHKFSHWALLDKNGAVIRTYNVGDKFDINEANLGEVTLKAIWVQSNGWTLDVPTLEKVGYESSKINWYTDVFCSNKIDVTAYETIKALSNKVLYADWTTPITYKVTYDLPNGATNTVTVTYGDYVHIPRPIKEGYTFGGWTITGAEGISSSDATNEDFLNLRSTSGTVVMTDKQTKNSYTVNINKNDGSGTTTETYYYGDTFTVKNPTRNGYIFAGWKITGMDGIVHTYGSSTTSSNSLSDVTTTTFKNLRGSSGTVTFTAYWKVDILTIGEYAVNGSNVSDTDGTNVYTVYTSINGTGWSAAPKEGNTQGRVIVYWAKESGTEVDMLTHTDRSVNGSRYNNIDIGSDTKEIIFIGNSSKTYINLCMNLCSFTNNQALTIRFIDFKFKTNESFAIKQWNAEGQTPSINLTIDVVGNCSIGSSYSGGKALYFPNQTITLTGSGTMSLAGGNGADATSPDNAGSDGGTAVVAGGLVVNMTGNLNITGGNGGAGCEGKTGTHTSNAGNGSNGGNGGMAIDCQSVSIINPSVKISIIGGNGGNGGKGGYIPDGSNNDGMYDIADAGNGGNGGNGGAPITLASLSNISCSSLELKHGNGGNGGAGGKGGNPAVLSNDYRPDQKSAGGHGGNGGSGFVAGNGGNGGKGGGSYGTDTWNHSPWLGVCGSGGNGGNGGNKICGVSYSNGVAQSLITNVDCGKGGSSGGCGDVLDPGEENTGKHCNVHGTAGTAGSTDNSYFLEFDNLY